MRQSWTDDRLDDLNAKVDRRFDQVDRRFERMEGELVGIRKEMKEGFEGLHRTLIQVLVGVVSFVGASLGGVLVLIATRL